MFRLSGLQKEKNDETRYQDLTNNELINDIQNEIDAITYASGDYFVYAIKYNKSGDIKEYFTGSLYQTSKYKSRGSVKSSKGYSCNLESKANRKVPLVSDKNKYKGKIQVKCINGKKFEVGKWTQSGRSGEGRIKDLSDNLYFEFKFATSKALLINHELNALKTDTTNLKVTKKTSKQKKITLSKKKICSKANEIYWYKPGNCSGSLAKIIKPSHSMYEYFYEQAELSANKNAKKTVEIAKVEEPKQEEFKPKNKNIDNDPPIIEIAKNIIVNDTNYEIKGRVKDKSDKIFIEIDGVTTQANNGNFKVKRYSPVDEQIKIVAIDKWGNKSKPKIINIKIDLKKTKVTNKIEPLNPANLGTKINKNKVALIIGVEKYENSPSAKYASLDAKYFKDYAKKAFGVSEENINLLTDEEANLSKTNSAFFKWLPSKIKPRRTDLIIFYSGHGLASSDGKEKYILPFNADPDLLSKTAISRNEIFDQIVALNPKSVTIFFDTCYSGVSRDEQMLLASARPLRILADDENKIPKNFTLFSASGNNQISSGLKDAKHGIFLTF